MIAFARVTLDILFASIWQGAVIAVAVAVLFALAGRRLNAATRYIALQGAAIAIAIVPLATTLPNIVDRASFLKIGSTSSAAHAFAVRGGSIAMMPRRIDVALSDRFVLMLDGIWIVGVLVSTSRLGAASLQLSRLLRRGSLLENRDGIRIFESPDLGVPIAIGFRRPSIVVPAVLAAQAGEKFDCVILHEIAHIRRGDAYMNAWDRALHALLYFNPALVLTLSAIALEREVACDDWAVAQLRDRAAYTRSLASFALWGLNAGPASAIAGSGFGHATIARINRLEDWRRNGTTTLSHYTLGGFTLVLFTIALTLNAFTPAIAFAPQTSHSNVTIASTSCSDSEVRYVNGPAPSPRGHVPNGLKTLVSVRVSSSGRAISASIFKASGNLSFDRAVIDAATKGIYTPQMQNCRPQSGRYLFEAVTG